MSYAPPPPGPPPPPPPPRSPAYGSPGYYYGPPMAAGAPMPHATRGGSTAIIAVFVGALIGVAVLVAVIVLANQPAPPQTCPDGVFCPPPQQPTLTPAASRQPGKTLPPLPSVQPTQPGQTIGPNVTPAPTPASNAAPYVSGTVWRSATLGYSFEYNPTDWTVKQQGDTYAQLIQGPVEMDVIGYSSSTSVEAALQDVYNQTDNFVIGRTPNTRSYDALLGPSIGFVRGDGDVFLGTWKTADGSVGDPVGITIMGATHGNATVVVVVLVTNPDRDFKGGTLQHAGRRAVDNIIQTFQWE